MTTSNQQLATSNYNYDISDKVALDSFGAQPAGARTKYRVVLYGGGVQELDRLAIRDHIRSGVMDPGTSVAPLGTEDWRAATDYPELARYFEMAAVSRRPSTPKVEVREVRTMGERIAVGAAYPLGNGQWATVLLIALFQALPLIWPLGTLGGTLLMLTIVRKSASGSLKMPAYAEFDDIGGLIWLYLRSVFITLVSLAPAIIVSYYTLGKVLGGAMHPFTAMAITTVFLVLAAIYYPACLATIAVWNNALAALNPVYVFRVIHRIGADYFKVVGMWFVATAVTGIMKFPSLFPLAGIPFIGTVIKNFLWLWVLFYASHLLGYAVYRHTRELEWD